MITNIMRTWVIPLTIMGMLSSCSIKNTDKNSPVLTPSPAAKTVWGATESAISNVVLGTPGGKCEWQMLGWMEHKRFIWAFCQSGSGVDATAVSVPAVVDVNTNGTIKSVTLPGEGKDYEISIRRLFPPETQEKIFAQDFDLYTSVTHLEARWINPALPPAIFGRYGKTLPKLGEETDPAISAATANRIVQQAELGQGNVKQVQYLPDGQIVLSGDRGIGFLDEEQAGIDYPFQNLLDGRPGFLSPDGKYLAAISDQVVDVFGAADQSHKVSIDTSDAKGILNRVQFLADGLTLVVEKLVPSEGFTPSWVALYRFSDGKLLNTWMPGGTNFVLSPNGYYLTGLYDANGMQVWSIANAASMYLLPVIASAASFSGDGQIMAVVELAKVKLIWVWDGFEIGRLKKNIGRISGVALSPDGKMVLTWSDGPDPARLWSVPDFRLLETFEIKGVSAAAFKRDGTAIAMVGDGAIGVYNLVSRAYKLTSLDTYNQVTDISFAPDRTFGQGQRLAVAYQPGPYHSVIVNWNLATREELFVRSESQVLSLVYMHDPYGIALGATDKSVVLIDAESGDPLRVFDGASSPVQGLAIDRGSHLAASSMSEVRIFALSNPDEKKGRDIRVSGGWVSDIVWPCYLAAVVDNGSVQVLDELGEKKTQSIIMPAPGNAIFLAAPKDCSQLLAAQKTSVYRLVSGSWDTLPSWELPGTITALAVSQDGLLAAVGSADSTIRLLDMETGVELRTLDGHFGPVTALEFSPDGSILASGGTDGVVIIWGVK